MRRLIIKSPRVLENKIRELELELEKSRLEQDNLAVELDEAYQKLYELCPHIYQGIISKERKEVLH
jgi:hypothetical protein